MVLLYSRSINQYMARFLTYNQSRYDGLFFGHLSNDIEKGEQSGGRMLRKSVREFQEYKGLKIGDKRPI